MDAEKSATKVFLEFSAGDVAAHNAETDAYENTATFLKAKGAMYGIVATAAPHELDAAQQELVTSVWDGERDFSMRGPPRFALPTPLVLGRVAIHLANLGPKAQANFIALCTGSKGMSKTVKTAALHFKGVPMHRIEQGFCAQGGDVTRRDGSGGDSIYGGKFNDEKPALVKGWNKGSVMMANSGKNSNTSQFFLVLNEDPARYAKIEGKHVMIGQVVEGMDVVDKLNAKGTPSGKPVEPVWISDCGIAT